MSEMKLCPYCAEEIRLEAIKCRHCASYLAPRGADVEWTRKSDTRMLAGVCAGLAERFDVSVTVLRLSFAIGALFSGFAPAVILYIILWVIMPLEPERSQLEARFTSREADFDSRIDTL